VTTENHSNVRQKLSPERHKIAEDKRIYAIISHSLKNKLQIAEPIGIITNGGSVFCMLFQNLKLSLNEMARTELFRFFCFKDTRINCLLSEEWERRWHSLNAKNVKKKLVLMR
jgi:hypothetical protein